MPHLLNDRAAGRTGAPADLALRADRVASDPLSSAEDLLAILAPPVRQFCSIDSVRLVALHANATADTYGAALLALRSRGSLKIWEEIASGYMLVERYRDIHSWLLSDLRFLHGPHFAMGVSEDVSPKLLAWVLRDIVAFEAQNWDELGIVRFILERGPQVAPCLSLSEWADMDGPAGCAIQPLCLALLLENHPDATDAGERAAKALERLIIDELCYTLSSMLIRDAGFFQNYVTTTTLSRLAQGVGGDREGQMAVLAAVLLGYEGDVALSFRCLDPAVVLVALQNKAEVVRRLAEPLHLLEEMSPQSRLWLVTRAWTELCNILGSRGLERLVVSSCSDMVRVGEWTDGDLETLGALLVAARARMEREPESPPLAIPEAVFEFMTQHPDGAVRSSAVLASGAVTLLSETEVAVISGGEWSPPSPRP